MRLSLHYSDRETIKQNKAKLWFREVVDYVKSEFCSEGGQAMLYVTPRQICWGWGSQLNVSVNWSGRWMGHSVRENVGVTLENRDMIQPDTEFASCKQKTCKWNQNLCIIIVRVDYLGCYCMHGMSRSCFEERAHCRELRHIRWPVSDSKPEADGQPKKPSVWNLIHGPDLCGTAVKLSGRCHMEKRHTWFVQQRFAH